ncbi:hypothetical protein HAX54_020838 [Datura stramonium]|uniref:Fatty acyl-CoA reductase n=1 Tax=Datura stramonium TaxID=4076 RepID=A0ABS8S3A5_DATST|nr:hypothetical protein [Datura stramonium]
MLRTTPKINKIYLLIRAKDKEAAFHRLTSEIIESKLFKCLKEMHGESYELFIRSKLVPVVGNIHESNLGMDIITSHQIAQEIDLIVDSAANTTWDLSHDVRQEMQETKTPHPFLDAYANGQREGLIYEKPFKMGESITKEKVTSHYQSTKFPSLNAANELDFVSKLKNAIQNNAFDKIMKDSGSREVDCRHMAKLYGWQDTYSFTKAIGEMIIDNMREDILTVIILSSGITTSYKEPFSRWVQGFRVTEPLIIFYGKGEYPCILGDPSSLIDMVVDMVVNTTMAAIAKHGYSQSPELNVYHVASSSVILIIVTTFRILL